MGIDINATDFLERFVAKSATVGIVGHGYVGKAVEYFFSETCRTLVHDKAKPEMSKLRQLVDEAELIFVCVPTPMRNDGSCHTGIVEEVLRDIVEQAGHVNRNLNNFIVVVKSTVSPGFTKRMKERHQGLRLLFSPEFLTEANSFQDFVNTNRVLLGGDVDDGRVAFKYFEARLTEKVEDGRVTIAACDSTVAETVKLFTNGFLATKVLFCNEMERLCTALEIPYEEVRVLSLLDRRIGQSHTVVPGPDGHKGFGGHCFVKDLNSLKRIADDLDTGQKLFTTVIERNLEVREDRDWEKMHGRAVIDE